MNPTIDSYIANIVDKLEDNKCVFLLGPYLSSLKKKEIQDEIIRFAKEEKGLNVKADLDGLYKTNDASAKGMFPWAVKEFIKENFELAEIHNQLVEIPGHLTISLSPDHLMEDAYRNKSIGAQFTYYSKTQVLQEELKFPTSNNPLVYNLFGSIYDEKSLILTQFDLIDFIFSIVKEKIPLPDILKSSLNEARVFIFLGFDFEQWYLKIILKILSELVDEGFGVALESEQGVSPNIRFLFKRNFDLIFVPSESDKFVNAVYEACAKKNILRETKELVENPIISIVQGMVKNNAIYEALDNLENYFDGLKGAENKECFKKTIAIRSRFQFITDQEKKGIVSFDNLTQELNRIREAILSIVSDLKSI